MRDKKYKSKTRAERIPVDFIIDIQKASKIRRDKKLCEKDLSLAEALRLYRKTNGHQMGLEELRSKPRKKKR